MEIKVALLLVSALIAVAAAYPYKDQQQATAAGVSCNYNAPHRVVIGWDTFSLYACTKSKLYNYYIAISLSEVQYVYILFGYGTMLASDTFFFSDGKRCILEIPHIARCTYAAGQCYNNYWYSGVYLWSSVICQSKRL